MAKRLGIEALGRASRLRSLPLSLTPWQQYCVTDRLKAEIVVHRAGLASVSKQQQRPEKLKPVSASPYRVFSSLDDLVGGSGGAGKSAGKKKRAR